jgi:DNA recombination protein RmuC
MDGTLLAAFGGTAALARMAAWGAVLAGGLLLVWLWRGTRARAVAEERARELDLRLAEMARLQAEMTGRMQTMAEVFGSRQADLARAVSERLDGLTHRLGSSMVETSRSTEASLARLGERMAVIDRAQRSMSDLASEVLQLRSILADKQARGAFGQGRMEAIVADALPPNAYTFQATLPTGVRPDCLIHLPNGAPPLVVDAKFPLEAWTALGAAETDDERKLAGTRFRRDVLRHVIDIRDKYLLPGETQDTAFLFVPSESIFADLHERFEDLVQKAQRARVVIVSPSLLMLSIQVVQAVLRDHRMREQAHLIQAEVVHLIDDVARLHDRVLKLQAHHGQAAKDLEQIVISSEKLQRRAARIEDVEMGEAVPAGPVVPIPLGASRLAGE